MAVRSWRTAFLTLRDETLVSPTPSSLNTLLQNLLFSQTDVLNAAAPDLPPHEVTSDVILLVELVKAAFEAEDAVDTFVHTCALIHDVSCRVCLEINSSSWAIMLEFLEKMLRCFLPKAVLKIGLLANATRMKLVMEILEIIRHLVNAYGRKCTLQESTQLVKLLIHIVACCNAELFQSAYSSGNQWGNAGETGSKMLKCQNLWEFQTIAFVMIGELLSRFGPSISVQIWQSTLEVLRKVMDSLVSKSLLVENSAMSRFYTSVLHCLHLVLIDPKGSLSDHVAGLVAALRMFFVYGITNRSPVCPDIRHIENGYSSIGHKSTFAEPRKSERGPYRPPHLREKEATKSPFRASDTRSSPDNELSALGFTSSDSEHSDNDGLGKDVDYFRSSKTRIAAIVCIQDLCQADPKAFTAHWTAILPTNNVLQPRKYEANLMTCLLFDPVLKARISSASTLAAMMGGPSSVSLQVAEYKESTRCGSYTALSSALGQILMQLHTGILYLVQHEAHNGLLASLFKILMLLISATPYARMPGELLSSVILSLSSRMIEGFPSRTDQIGLLAISLSCLGAAFSTSPPSLQVKELLQEEMSTGGQGKQSVLSLIFQLSERVANPTISFEALQVLRAVSHNYPSIMGSCWEKTSTLVYGLLRVAGPRLPGLESSARISKGDVGSSAGSLGERCIMAAVKVLDECLRAISGFKGTEDLKEDLLLETPFTSDCTRTKRISSAPSYGLDILEVSKGNLAIGTPGNKEWSEAIEKHLPLVISHGSAMVRAASVTCYAGITSSVFFSLMKEHQDFILSSTISAALKDEIPSVRSAACRAIGVIACFPQIAQRAEILDKFINAAEINSHDPVVSVRITASWALANICDLARHRSSELDSDMCSTDLMTDSRRVAILVECALRSSKDGDKIKSNAVRALGNLSRFVRFGNLSTIHKEHDRGDTSVSTYSIRHSSHTSTNVSGLASLGDPKWLERMVQAFVSCVTTGNVKVQWNVCHALSNLFLNETLKLHDMAWAPSVFSILLLLLRDSSNYKIRIHAAAALAVPCSKLDYGSSFSDVVQGLEQVLENLDSDQISTALNIKYIDALEKQLTASNLHVLSLVPCGDNVPLNDFLVKKASFLEEWLNSLCSSIAAASYQPEEESALPENQVDQSQATIQKKADASYQPEEESPPAENQVDQSQATIQKKEMIYKTIKALIEVYRRSNHQRIAERFEKLIVSGS